MREDINRIRNSQERPRLLHVNKPPHEFCGDVYAIDLSEILNGSGAITSVAGVHGTTILLAMSDGIRIVNIWFRPLITVIEGR
jgi:hypothetical protein